MKTYSQTKVSVCVDKLIYEKLLNLVKSLESQGNVSLESQVITILNQKLKSKCQKKKKEKKSEDHTYTMN